MPLQFQSVWFASWLNLACFAKATSCASANASLSNLHWCLCSFVKTNGMWIPSSVSTESYMLCQCKMHYTCNSLCISVKLEAVFYISMILGLKLSPMSCNSYNTGMWWLQHRLVMHLWTCKNIPFLLFLCSSAAKYSMTSVWPEVMINYTLFLHF